MTPLISVIIPCYNQGIYIDEALNSVFIQTYQNFEIIIVNDGSTDPFTIKKLHIIDHPKIQVFHTHNQGLPAARNYAIKQSKGVYILPLDADDRIAPTFLEKTVTILHINHAIAIVGTHFQHFGYSSYQGTYGVSGSSALYVKSDPNTLCTSLFRKAEWKVVGGYDESMTLGLEDWEFWIRLLEHTKKTVHIIEEILFFYRIKEHSMAIEVNATRDERIQLLLKRHHDVYKNNFFTAIVDREKKIIQLKEDSKIIPSLGSKLLVSHLDTVPINAPILIYGMSQTAQLLFHLLREKSLDIKAVIDQQAEYNSLLYFNNIPVISLKDAIKTFSNVIIVITSITNHQLLESLIRKELNRNNCKVTTVSIDGVAYLNN